MLTNPVPVLTNKLQALTMLMKRAGEHTIHTVIKKNHKVKRKEASACKMLRPSAYEKYTSAFQQIGSTDEALIKI